MIDSCMKIGLKIFHGLSMESDTIGDSYYFSYKNIIPLIKFDPGHIPFIGHYVLHGVTSSCLNHSRKSST